MDILEDFSAPELRASGEPIPPIGDPAEPFWRSRRNGRLLSAVNRMGQMMAETAAHTDRLRVAKRHQLRVVQHLLPDSALFNSVTPSARHSTGSQLICDAPLTPGAVESGAFTDGAATAGFAAETCSNKMLLSHTRRETSHSRLQRVVSLIRHQSALLPSSPRTRLQLSDSEEQLLQQALEMDPECDPEGSRQARQQLMLQVWEREAEHRRQQEGPPSRRCSDPRLVGPPDRLEVRHRHHSEELSPRRELNWTDDSAPASPSPPPEEEQEQPDAPAPVIPSFPMQDPGKEVEIKEGEVKVQERSENEWAAEWDWAERERRRNVQRASRGGAAGSSSASDGGPEQQNTSAEPQPPAAKEDEIGPAQQNTAAKPEPPAATEGEVQQEQQEGRDGGGQQKQRGKEDSEPEAPQQQQQQQQKPTAERSEGDSKPATGQ